MVRSGLVMAWRFATCPTSRSPSLRNATTDGVVRLPSSLVSTLGSRPSIIATTLLVVPRSMPMIFPTKNLQNAMTSYLSRKVTSAHWVSNPPGGCPRCYLDCAPERHPTFTPAPLLLLLKALRHRDCYGRMTVSAGALLARNLHRVGFHAAARHSDSDHAWNFCPHLRRPSPPRPRAGQSLLRASLSSSTRTRV